MKIKVLWIVTIICLSMSLSAQVLPHPLKTDGIPPELIGDDFNDSFQNRNGLSNRNIALTNNVLVLRIDFPDHPFNMDISFPSFHPQNKDYFQKYMEHVKTFYSDASSGLYELQYFIAPEVYTMSESLGWYGDDNFESRRRVLLIAELIDIIGSDLSFRDYEALIVFHSGAGQESSLFNNQRHTLWSTFMSINTFRSVLDPDNLDYEGIPTADGSFITKTALIASSQFHEDFINHPDFEKDPNSFHFETLGVLATQYGRIMGLPTLFGNVSAFGQHAGTGNFCIMGTGTWNNNGKTPPLPSAWVRYFAGWETPVEITQNEENLHIAYHMVNDSDLSKIFHPKLFKINISEKEYFLIENRQHNYIKDFVTIVETGELRPTITHTFELLDDDLQDYMIVELQDGTGHHIKIPMVNLMKNNLKGSEWDFFLPWTIAGLSESYQDPSGLLIWHIDENIIAEKYLSNTINGNPSHMGVALKEADGIQHMASNLPHFYMRGGPFKTYRTGNNEYIGNRINPFTGFVSIPNAGSHYGGISFEVYNIGYSDDTMTFSVRFDPFSETDFSFENHLEPFVFDFLENDVNIVHYFHSDGFMTLFENHTKLGTYWLESDTLSFNYTFDGQKNLVIPAQDKFIATRAKLINWDGVNLNLEAWEADDLYWSSSPVFIDDDWKIDGVSARWILSLSNNGDLENLYYKIFILDENFNQIYSTYCGKVSNLVYNNQEIVFINTTLDEGPALFKIDSDLNKSEIFVFGLHDLEYLGDWKLYKGDFSGTKHDMYIMHYSDSNLNKFFVFDESLQERHRFKELNLDMPYRMTGQPVFKDITRNGMADIILSHANGFSAFTINGSPIRSVTISNPDPLNQGGSGIVAWNWANNDDVYFVGGFSKNRLMFFDNRFNVISNLTKTLAHPLQTLPYITAQKDGVFIYQATDKGRVYNVNLPLASNTDNLYWNLTMGNYYRNGFWQDELVNKFAGTKGIFVKEENYSFPSPWIKRHHTHLRFHVMTTIDTTVEISIYNISGQLITRMSDDFVAFEGNREKFTFNPGKWSSGVYFAVLKAQSDSIYLKFAIEK